MGILVFAVDLIFDETEPTHGRKALLAPLGRVTAFPRISALGVPRQVFEILPIL